MPLRPSVRHAPIALPGCERCMHATTDLRLESTAMRWLFVICCLLFASLSHAMAAPSLDAEAVDKVLVLKSERKLHLLSRGEMRQVLPGLAGQAAQRSETLRGRQAHSGRLLLDQLAQDQRKIQPVDAEGPPQRRAMRPVRPQEGPSGRRHDHDPRHAAATRSTPSRFFQHPRTGPRAASP